MSRAQERLSLCRRAAALLLTVALLGSTAAMAAEEPLPEEQLEQVGTAIAQIEDWLRTAASDRTALEQALRDSNTAITANRTAILDTETQILALREELQQLERQQNELEQALASQEALVRQALRASYSSGRDSYLKLMLTQEDTSRSARMLRYYSDFNRARLDGITTYRTTLQALDANTVRLLDTEQTLQSSRQTLEDAQAAMATETARRESLLAELAQEMATRSTQLTQLREDQQRLESLVQQIRDVVINIPAPEDLAPFAQARGRLPRPVDGEALNRFGESYSDGNLHRQGIVLGAAEGTPVRAVHPGRVVFADWLRGSGLLVVVDHGAGYMSLYANTGSLIKRNGDWVNRGEPLATAGSDGGSGQPGLYFEIRHDGQAQDPAQWWQP
jgi:septal ring factor EnvC (AmiA/AmiB activator)